MPQVFDNISLPLLPALQGALRLSSNADFCVGYFNLRGWKQLDAHIEHWSQTDGACRLLVGMQRAPQDELRDALSLASQDGGMDNQKAVRLKKELAVEFRRQLMFGAPNNEDEKGLRQLARRLREKKVVTKLFLRHPLHAKLYLLFRPDPNVRYQCNPSGVASMVTPFRRFAALTSGYSHLSPPGISGETCK